MDSELILRILHGLSIIIRNFSRFLGIFSYLRVICHVNFHLLMLPLVIFFIYELALRLDRHHLISIHRISKLILPVIHVLHSRLTINDRSKVERLIILWILHSAWCHWLTHHEAVLFTDQRLTINGMLSPIKLRRLKRVLSFATNYLIFVFFLMINQGFLYRCHRCLKRRFKYLLYFHLNVLRDQWTPVLWNFYLSLTLLQNLRIPRVDLDFHNCRRDLL